MPRWRSGRALIIVTDARRVVSDVKTGLQATRFERLATSLKFDVGGLVADVNVSATGSGSEILEDSTSTWSNRRSAAKVARDVNRSSRSVQQNDASVRKLVHRLLVLQHAPRRCGAFRFDVAG